MVATRASTEGGSTFLAKGVGNFNSLAEMRVAFLDGSIGDKTNDLEDTISNTTSSLHRQKHVWSRNIRSVYASPRTIQLSLLSSLEYVYKS